MSIDKMIKSVIAKLNKKTQEDYIIYACRPGQTYTCGRAVASIYLNEKNHILIFNTVSEDDDNMDMEYYQDLLKKNTDQKGGMYKKKYLNYKKKYLELKKRMN